MASFLKHEDDAWQAKSIEALKDTKKSYKGTEENDHLREVDISVAGTMSAAGEMTNGGALGAFSFDELIGNDIVGDAESPANRAQGEDYTKGGSNDEARKEGLYHRTYYR